MRRPIRWVLASFLCLTSLAFSVRVLQVAPVVSGYGAKIMAGGVFLSGRSPESIVEEDLRPVLPLPSLLWIDVDRTKCTVTASLCGLGTRRARLRPGLGCPLDPVKGPSPLDELAPLPARPSSDDDPRPWPLGDRTSTEPFPATVKRYELDRVVATAFSEAPSGPPLQSRAVLVVWRDRIVAERYGPQIQRHSPLIGWSMSKSVTGALIGLAVSRGLLKAKDPVLHPVWSKAEDPRRAITVEHLLHMRSGLAFDESYGLPPSDVTRLLFLETDPAAFAADRPLVHAPGSHFAYSTATSKLLAWVLLKAHGGRLRDSLRFPREALFGPLGMKTAVMEPAPNGLLMGGSFVWASARDWARFGLLYLHDGVWEGRRLLPEGWVQDSFRPAPSTTEKNYGVQCWLNGATNGPPPSRPYPSLPEDCVFFQGHEGQQIALIPSRDLLVLRLGATHPSNRWDRGAFTTAVLRCFP